MRKMEQMGNDGKGKRNDIQRQYSFLFESVRQNLAGDQNTPPSSIHLLPSLPLSPSHDKEDRTREKDDERERQTNSKGESSEQAKRASGGGSKGFGSLGCQFAALMKASGRDTTPVHSPRKSPLHLLLCAHTPSVLWVHVAEEHDNSTAALAEL